MPHRCTNCGRTFPDGSKEMLSGCPDCGGNKFQFLPGDATGDDRADESTPPAADRAPDPHPGRATPSRADTDLAPEDTAQASARRTVVSRDELPPVDRPDGANEDDAPTVLDADSPDLDELRAELNDQFESIRILRPGEYELNLMELYDREEYIVALEEDGRYVIGVPGSWRD